MARLRVLHLIHSSAFGGGPAMVELLCTRLHGREFEMSLVSSGEGEMPDRLSRRGLRVVSLPLASKGSFVRNIPRLAAAIKEVSPDLVHVHGHFAASLGQFAIQPAGRFRTVYSAQWPAYLDDTNPYSRVRNWVAEAMSCRLAKRVVAVSEHDRRTLIRRRLCSPAKLTLIYNTYDPQKFTPPQWTPDLKRAATTNGAVLGFVGRLAEQKGCEFLIRAMPAVKRSHPGTRLRIVGDGPERESLEALAATLAVTDAVEFLGYRPASAELLSELDAMIVPSLYEPFGIVAVEAMACGLSVVASAVGGLAEIVMEGKTGYLVPPRDPARLAEAIGRLLESPQLRIEMGENGRKLVREKFSPDVCVAAYAAEYRRVAGD